MVRGISRLGARDGRPVCRPHQGDLALRGAECYVHYWHSPPESASGHPFAGDERTPAVISTLRDAARLALALASAGAGAIHLALGPAHMAEWDVLGYGFY